MLNLFLLFMSTILFNIQSYSCQRMKIVGGRYANVGEFPFTAWIVSFERKSRKSCGGSVISRLFVISACHCFINLKLKNEQLKLKRNLELFKVIAGTIDIHEEAFTPKINEHADTDLLDTRQYWKNIRQIDMAVIHPKCEHNEFTLVYDAALIRLNFPLVFSQLISVVPLYSKNEDSLRQHIADLVYEETPCYVVGWGNTKISFQGNSTFYSTVSSILKTTSVLLVSDPHCLNFHCYSQCVNNSRCCPNIWTNNQVICGLPIHHSDACQGDSGGPLICKGFMTGIVSYGVACGDKISPTMYTALHSVLDIFNYIFENGGFL